jgi:protein-tyrosine-phosphatase
LPDPAGKSMEFMRSVRDEIENRVKNLVNSIAT